MADLARTPARARAQKGPAQMGRVKEGRGPGRGRATADLARAIESNLRATERCHLSLMPVRHAQLRLRMLAHEAAGLPALSRLLGGARLRAIRGDAAALRDLLRAAAPAPE